MATRSMEKLAEAAEHNKPTDYDINSSEILRLMKMARDYDPNETFNCVVMAFNFGFVMGHRATVKGKVKKRL